MLTALKGFGVALIAGTALISTSAFAGMGGGGNWPHDGAWNWPEYAGSRPAPTCQWVQVKLIVNGHVQYRSVQRCE